MGDKSKIEWCDATWNPVTGCTKVSRGCKNCYAEGVANRFWGDRKFTDIQCHEDRLDQPLRWKKPRRIFVNSMSDLFHPDVPDKFIGAVWSKMLEAPQHTFVVLTKRPARMADIVARLVAECEKKGLRKATNIWLGVSVETQKEADIRIPLLLQTPAAVRFVSCEPLLGPVDLSPWVKPRSFDDLIQLDKWNRKEANESKEVFGLNEKTIDVDGKPYTGRFLEPEKLDWVIVGGESGPHARPMHPDWVRLIRNQCVAAGTSFFFKQWGRYVYSDRMFDSEIRWVNKANGWMSGLPSVVCVDMDGKSLKCGGDFMTANYPVAWGWYEGKKAAGRMLDGQEWNEFPASPKVICEDCAGFGCCEEGK